MRSVLLGFMLASVAGVAVAQDWGNMAVISSTLGNNTRRLCIGDHARPGDIGCPTWAPSLTTAGDMSVTGNLSAAKFVGDGSGLTNIAGASADRIVSGTTSMLAISNTGYVSLTQSGVNTGWFDPSRGLVTIGVSSTGPISATALALANISTGLVPYQGTNGQLTAESFLSYNSVNHALTAYQHVANDNSGYKWGDGSGRITGAGGAGYLAFSTSNTEAMRIVSTGYVGIATSSPSYNIDVSGTGRITGGLISGYLSTGYINLNSGDGIRWNGNADYMFGYTGVGQHYLTFNTSSTEAMRIVSSGYVGIGTGAPGYPLDVSMSSANLVRFGNSSQNVTLGAFSVANSSGNLAVRSANDLNFQSGASAGTKMVLQAGGYVGIGTSSPNVNLEVSGTVSATRFVGDGSGLYNIAGASADRIVSGTTSMLAISTTGYVSLTQSGVNTGWFDPSRGLVTIGVSSTGPISATSMVATGNILANGSLAGTNLTLAAVNGSGGTINWFDGTTNITGSYPSKYIAFTTSGTEAMRIVSSGYVGIGTNAPAYKLQVAGDAQATNVYANNKFKLLTQGGSYAWPNSAVYITGNDASQLYMAFATSSTEAMRIVSNGTVGIGTQSPTAKLEVSGTISATNLVVNGVSITGTAASADRIVSGSVNMIAEQTSGTVRVSGTLALVNTGSEVCDAVHYYTIRANPITQQLEMCRP